MNPTDLRTELSARAAESEGHQHGDLLPGVRRKIRRTKQRRVATALASTAAVAAIAVGVLPNLSTTTAPAPAATTPVPQDVIRNGIIFDAEADGHLLQAAGIGDAGQTTTSFEWTPRSKEIVGYTACSTSSQTATNLRVSVDGVEVGSAGCMPGETEPVQSFMLAADDALWTRLSLGRKARVDLAMVDTGGRPVRDARAAIGAGLYTGPDVAVTDRMPSQPGPTGPDDYVKDGIRYRAKVAGDTLLAAEIGDPGSTEVTFGFTPPTDVVGLRAFCLAGGAYWYRIAVNGRSMTEGECTGGSTDPGAAGGITGVAGDGLPAIRPGEVNTATIRLTDRNHRAVSMPAARLGLGIYRIGAQRLVGTGQRVALDEIREYAGHLYRLGAVRTASARGESARIDTPAGVPFLVAYGVSDTGIASTTVELTGLDDAPILTGMPSASMTLTGQPGRTAGTATLRVTEGKPTKGELIVAVYTPMR